MCFCDIRTLVSFAVALGPKALQESWTPGGPGKCLSPPKSALEEAVKICGLPRTGKFLKDGLKRLRRLRRKAYMLAPITTNFISA